MLSFPTIFFVQTGYSIYTLRQASRRSWRIGQKEPVRVAFFMYWETAQESRQAALALDLAQGRYNLGLASIVELTQAQLNVTQAEIENLSAKHGYQTQIAALQYRSGLLR